jgi:hypothetical protein
MPKPTAIQSVSLAKHIFMGLYGVPGIGKSRLAGTSPGRVLILRPPSDHLNSLLPPDKARVEEWIIRNWSDMNDAEEYLRHEGGQYDWVWLDSLSLCQDFLLDNMFEDAVQRKPSRAEYGPDQAEYGVNMYRIGAWMRHAVVGPDLFNFGWTGHAAALPSPDVDDDGDPIEKLMPWVQGKNMSPKCCGYMNLVCFMEQAGKKGRRVLRSQSDPRYYAKDGFDAFPEGVLWDPTMPKVIDLIEKSSGRIPAATTKPNGKPKAARRITTPRKRVGR